ncbi:hypothetical protein EMGBS8_01120 [Verrucomicrobiota bacterium]|jgi:hypothetical protein|nr:hypothetical protein EMGBS8_01120 [Verrucomicrobiota bacterium]
MNNEDHDIESALRRLRPRPPGPAVVSAIGRALDAPTSPAASPSARGIILRWSAGLSAAAACLLGFFFFARPTVTATLEYQLVRAEQPPATVDVFAPVRLADGSFARPVRVRWSNETQWEDRRTNTRLINYSPSEQFGLIPMETY